MVKIGPVEFSLHTPKEIANGPGIEWSWLSIAAAVLGLAALAVLFKGNGKEEV